LLTKVSMAWCALRHLAALVWLGAPIACGDVILGSDLSQDASVGTYPDATAVSHDAQPARDAMTTALDAGPLPDAAQIAPDAACVPYIHDSTTYQSNFLSFASAQKTTAANQTCNTLNAGCHGITPGTAIPAPPSPLWILTAADLADPTRVSSAIDALKAEVNMMQGALPRILYFHQTAANGGAGIPPLFDTDYTPPGQLTFVQQLVTNVKACP
jgi:hypothetical protein